MTERHSISEVYEARRSERLTERSQRERVGRRLAWARLAAFAATLALAWAASSVDDASRRSLGVVAVASFVAFVWLVRRHRHEKRRVEWLDALAQVNAEAASRVRRDWRSLPDAGWRPAESGHPYADDLDLIGQTSLAQLLPRVSTAPGREILRSWLLAPASPEVIRERQAAVAELAPLLDFRDALSAFGRRIWLTTDGQTQLERWAVGDPWLIRRPWLIALSIATAATMIVLIVLAIAGVVPSTLWVTAVPISILLTARNNAALRRTLGPVAGKADTLAGYAEMLRLVSAAAFTSPLLRRLQTEVARGDRPAHQALESLRVLADCSQVRASPMLYAVLQAIGLWDFHIAYLVERWQGRHGQHVAQWLAALGQIESLAALSALAHGNPMWTFPDVSEGTTSLAATGLGHPLLAEDVAVANDVVVGPSGTFLLITGSNMSGKSTLLRAIGLNAVLAQAGGPVSATTFRCPPVALHTSMRIRDSLADGVSYFMAEVLRLKRVIEATRSPADPRRLLLYLFDEMLQGTNARERTIATQRILSFLSSTSAIGALATHDLRLLDSALIARAAHLAHFREDVVEGADGPALHFDYRLRPGPASSTNALKLMELAGLPVAGPPDEA